MSTWLDNRHDTPSKVCLLGEYFAVLSCKEVNEWAEYLWTRPEYIKYNENTFSLKSIEIVYRGCERESDIFELIREIELDQLELTKKLHHIAYKWHTQVILPRDKKNDQD